MSNIGLSAGGPPETILPPEPEASQQTIQSALAGPEENRHAALSAAVAANPRSLEGWARLGDEGRNAVEAYAAYRVGYHRGLDTLRQNGWRGSGFVRWEHPTNRGFLRALYGLERKAAEIGEADEEQRCAVFLRQLDPAWPPPEMS